MQTGTQTIRIDPARRTIIIAVVVAAALADVRLITTNDLLPVTSSVPAQQEVVTVMTGRRRDNRDLHQMTPIRQQQQPEGLRDLLRPRDVATTVLLLLLLLLED